MGRHKEFDQEKAVDQALDLFWEKGYESTSIQDLCDHLGIHRGSLYDTFGDKHELFLACLDRFSARTDENYNYILKEDSDSPKEQLERYFSRVMDVSLSNAARGRGCLMTNTTLGAVAYVPNVASRIDAHYMHTEGLLFSFLMRAQNKGLVRSKQSPRQLARFLNGVKQGVHVMARTTADRGVLEDICAVAVSTVF
ncbi:MULTISPECIES: TetR/AcrR family transcriptional regulator [unclassified Paenibacillus]|jgi:TetR/AcrR family transcriptional repressor of nem operon|uniref:TetR/AcrR family transcriptional regulator n=1 Tax=unclassified Paenibacillus TaxID=185978 RepID=UPI00178AC596|nr:TetR/AcrR family transcriptional regulator [Paenibacillus sp. S28]MBJ9991938.1 TetR/AcrR family transcriptional regulator [Paenibacillus sp. S28]